MIPPIRTAKPDEDDGGEVDFVGEDEVDFFD